jgi:hypothetical protein
MLVVSLQVNFPNVRYEVIEIHNTCPGTGSLNGRVTAPKDQVGMV